MKDNIILENAESVTQEELVYVESLAKMIYEMLVTIGDPEYTQKIYSIVYAKHNGI